MLHLETVFLFFAPLVLSFPKKKHLLTLLCGPGNLFASLRSYFPFWELLQQC